MEALKKTTVSGGYGFRNLLFFLLLYIFGSPFLATYPSLAILVHTSLSVTLLFSVYAVKKEQNYRTTAMVCLLPVLVLYWLGIYNLIPFSRVFSFALLSIYFALLIFSFAAQIARDRQVTLNIIYGALCIYLMLGLFWGGLYALLYELDPTSYAGALLQQEVSSNFHVFIYFSMVTLTTLGYGDITPQTLGASSLCQMEAIIGQLFTTVVIAWLVGNYAFTKKISEE
ncbi:MAG: Ion channel protein [Desulfotalea sp.]|nr:MAG: Ion channel protein [Desulfotalea sp.]